MLEPVQNKIPKKKRVCAYARVSTDSRKQGESLENQISSYERSLKANPEYEFVGVFADQGISGFSRNRPEFQRMVQVAKDGQIDLIITKSISRFARNTAVLLETVRELRLIGVAVYFEEQNINTLSGDGEVMLTVLASFAEEESRNVSENGEVQSYYMEDSHPAILSTEVWDALQEKIEENKRGRNIAQSDTQKYQNRYPLTGMLYCPHCGKTLRRRIGYKKKVEWLCSTYIEEGKQACPGVRISDESASRQDIIEPTVTEEVYRNGKKYYRYTSKAEFDSRERESRTEEEIAGGGVLPGEYRPRRTAIKL